MSPNVADRTVGFRIRSYREAAGLSQDRLAQSVGVTFQQIQKYEKGANRVSVGRLLAIAAALGVSVDLLMPPTAASAHPPAPSLFDTFLATPNAVDLMRGWLALPPSMRKTVLAMLGAMADHSE